MKKLLLMRHSYAASNNPAWTDRERPLSDLGRRVATETGALLSDEQIDLIIYSSAVRTTETAKLIQQSCASDVALKSCDYLYLASAGQYIEAAHQFGAQFGTVLIIGHNPGISALINSWSDESLAINPACVAIFRLDADDWHVLGSGNARPDLEGFISEAVRAR